MEIDDVIWLDDIVEKIATKHGVETLEVKEVLLANPEFRRGEKGNRKGEKPLLRVGPDGSRALSFRCVHPEAR